MNIKGIHHLTAITGNAEDNYKFYTEVLGMRLVKKTVNQDDITAYHLFYGDEKGSPGTELTFFDFPGIRQTIPGPNSISNISLRVPNNAALSYWLERFKEFGVKHSSIMKYAGRESILFEDPEGQQLTLVSDETNIGIGCGTPWGKSPVPVEFGITGLGPVKLTVRISDPTIQILEILGFTEKERIPAIVTGQKDIVIMQVGEGGSGAEVQVEVRHDLPQGMQGKGGVHHVAFGVDNEEELNAWIDKLNKVGLQNTGFVERFYFRSVYFREPNGILFELATDGPGFATDEPLETLGESLSLPPFLEDRRESIEAGIKPLQTRR